MLRLDGGGPILNIEVGRFRVSKSYNHLRPHSSLGYLAPKEFAARNQVSSAIARTAWPAKQMLAGAVQCTSASDPNPDSFSAALRE